MFVCMNSKPLVPGKLEEKKGGVKSMFTGEVETMRDRLQRQQIVNDLNYGLESNVWSGTERVTV